MNLRDMLKAKKQELAGLSDKIKAGDADAIKASKDLVKEINDLTERIKAADAAMNIINVIGTEETGTADAAEAKPAKSLGENFINFVKASGHAKKFDLAAPVYVKAATDTQTSPSGAVDFATTFDKNVVTAARTPLVIRDLFGAENISGSTLQYLVEGAIQGAPAVTTEGAEKPQIHFADPTPKTVSLKKIACHIKESDEYIDDYPFLASAINGRLIYELGLVEQNTLVTDLLATSGIQTGSITAAATYLDVADEILKAAMDVQLQSGFAADAIALNPADWFKLRTLKLTTNEYFGGGPFGAQNVPNLWGIPVCVTTAITANKFVVGAFKTCGSVVSKGGVSVEATNTNEDDFVKNLMTIRAEERLALAVRRPAGFKVLTKATT